MKKYTFSKVEKLKSEKTIKQLFDGGKEVFKYPFKCVYRYEDTGEVALPKVAVVASKRNFKRAVDRNLIKRRMKEAYRLQAVDFKKNMTQPLSMCLIYIGKDIEPLPKMEKAMKQILGLIQPKTTTH